MNMFQNSRNQNNVNLSVKNFIMVQTGSYQEQHLRPFAVNATKQALDALTEATNFGTNLGVAAVQEIASDIIQPVANTEGMIGIDQGWRSRRFRFLMKVEESHPFIHGTTTQRIFFGYTDQCDASFNHLDPEMRIYFNSETVISQSIENTPAGPVYKSNIASANQIISPVGYDIKPANAFNYDTLHLIRPEDIFSLSQTNIVAQKLSSSGAIDGPIHRSIDHRTLSGPGSGYKYSKRRDTSPTRYLSNTLGSYQQAVKEYNDNSLDGADTSVETLLGEAAAFSRNSQLYTNTFLAVLRDRAGYMEKGFVTLRELQDMFPETRDPNILMYSMDNGQSMRKVNLAEDSQGWGGADYTSIGASLIAQTVPSIMMDSFFRSISFSVTNGTGPNNYLFDLNPNMTKSIIDNVNMMPYIHEFERRLSIDTLNSISRGNQLPFRLIVSSDLAGDTVIDISVGGESMARYIAPTFSDSLFSPVVTRDVNLPGTVSNDMYWLVSEVIPTNMNVMSQPMQGYNHPQAILVTPQKHTVGESYDSLNLGLV